MTWCLGLAKHLHLHPHFPPFSFLFILVSEEKKKSGVFVAEDWRTFSVCDVSPPLWVLMFSDIEIWKLCTWLKATAQTEGLLWFVSQSFVFVFWASEGERDDREEKRESRKTYCCEHNGSFRMQAGFISPKLVERLMIRCLHNFYDVDTNAYRT